MPSISVDMATNQRVELFWDLRRYLKTENVEIEGLTKSQLRNWYANEYKSYKQQITPDEKLPTFFLIMQTMYKMKLAHFNDDVLALGPCPQMKKEKSPNQSPKKHKHLKQMKTNDKGELHNSQRSAADRSKQRFVQMSTPKGDEQGQVVQPADGTMTLNGRTSTRKQLMNRHKMAVDQHLTFKSGLDKVVNQPDFKGDPTEWKYIGKTERGYYCTLCQSKLTSKPDADRHLEGRRHRLATSMNIIRSKKDKLVEGSPTITVTADVEEKDGTYFIHTEENEVKMVEIVLTNKGDMEVELAHCEMMKKVRVFTLRDNKKVTDGMGTVKLIPAHLNYNGQLQIQYRAGPIYTNKAMECSMNLQKKDESVNFD
ncbi:uncharacterized protein LOC132716503 [Ruditapes philippinarum]|uniref:uncharacterized protein LOC132716503 n=1 Tax=Ruditapes philippinarum TaxID=129788 RepID=UPI00295BDBAF|nr:uncharacterized protein LOC132716503 [Ruditapes philippinarum]